MPVGSRHAQGGARSPERQIILQVLESNSWNRHATAESLGINRTTLYKKMKRLGLEDGRFAPLARGEPFRPAAKTVVYRKLRLGFQGQ